MRAVDCGHKARDAFGFCIRSGPFGMIAPLGGPVSHAMVLPLRVRRALR